MILSKEPSADHTPSAGELRRNRIIKRAAMEFKNDMYGILASCTFYVHVRVYRSLLFFFSRVAGMRYI